MLIFPTNGLAGILYAKSEKPTGKSERKGKTKKMKIPPTGLNVLLDAGKSTSSIDDRLHKVEGGKVMSLVFSMLSEWA
jgi:hypothetical protein